MFKKSHCFLLGLIIFFCASCVSLEHVNTFANTSVAGMKEWKNIDFNFTTYCSDYTEMALKPLLDTTLKIGDMPVNACTDEGFKNADSILNIYNNVLTAYLSGLEKLSDKKLLAFYLDDLALNMQGLQAQVFKDVTLSATQVAAAQDFAAKLLEEPLNIYRKKKLKRIILQNDSAFNHIMDAYIFSLGALSGELNQAKANYASFVSGNLFVIATSPVEKALIVQDYRKRMSELNKNQQALQNYISAMKAVRGGYNALAGGNLKDDNVKKSVRNYVLHVLEMIQDINELK